MPTPMQTLVKTIQDNITQVPKDTENSVSLGFFNIAFKNEHAEPTAREFYDQIVAALDNGVFANSSLDELASGPSYIQLGGWIGDQTLALGFMGLGALLGLWEVMTPFSLGITDEETAGGMMGMGFIMTSGIKEPV